MQTISGSAVPTLDVIEEIVGVRDPVIRNLRITHCYHELTTCLADRLRGGANWCGFATWASKQAGRTIRGEDLSATIEEIIGRSPSLNAALEMVVERARALGSTRDAATIRRVLVDLLDLPGAVDRAGDAVARGNLKVFAEIGRTFAGFLQSCCGDTEADPARIGIFVAGLREGDPPDGQRLLRSAFSRYYRALFEPDPRKRAELLLLANLEVGFHEQTRLQPEIAEALNVAIPDADRLTPRLIAAVLPRHAALVSGARRIFGRLIGGPTPLDRAMRSLVDLARREIRLSVTEQVMTLAMPGGAPLRLGRDLSMPYPATLATLEHPELLALLGGLTTSPGTALGSGARDWADLRERMHFIAELFRCYHENTRLLDPPFSSEQVRSIVTGVRPTGPL